LNSKKCTESWNPKLEYNITRIWDLDPLNTKTSTGYKIVIGGSEIENITKHPELRSSAYLAADTAPILWYAVNSTISNQASCIIDKILPYSYFTKSITMSSLLWIPT